VCRYGGGRCRPRSIGRIPACAGMVKWGGEFALADASLGIQSAKTGYLRFSVRAAQSNDGVRPGTDAIPFFLM
jgi:hypothetical protein